MNSMMNGEALTSDELFYVYI